MQQEDYFDEEVPFEDESDGFDEAFLSMSENDADLWSEDDLSDEDEDDGYIEDDYIGVGSNDTVGMYLKEMARVPLLSTEEEIDLAMRIEAGVDAERKLRHN